LSNLSTIELLTISGSESIPVAAGKPSTTDVPTIVLAGQTYTITRNLFNGLSQACSYGDDLQNATNYPIVRLTPTGGAVSQVYYCRSFDFLSMGISTTTH
jgi:hypothetical protein